MIAVPDRFEDVSDAGLAVAIARYDQAALAETYRRHAGAVFGLARRLLVEPAEVRDELARIGRELVDRYGATAAR